MVGAQGKVVVGFDASDESRVALQWAIAVANRRQVPLLVVHATGLEDPGPTVYRAGVAVMSQRRAQEIAEDGAAIARREATVEVEAAGVERGAVAALVDYSDGAELIVVGNRGRGRLRGALLGSVAFDVTTHARCPVAVVRGSLRPLPSADIPIVVGIDGSENGETALDEAARLAAATQSYLRIAVAWSTPGRNLWRSSFTHHEDDAREGEGASDNPWTNKAHAENEQADRPATDVPESASALAERAAEHVSSAHPGLRVELVVAEGRAEEVIVDAADGASLIVVGARGRGDFASLMLGSVSRDVIQHAECAVYVVR
ncbi:universal stress protein [Pseudactinotalea sp. HY158]|uniref:universal stress protein n=1 Tax=Pseudactinotalea sp. HY158 TaxID=2654547 RepID=UPI00129CFC5C|nr:universal stress protein [Pseudactinotalea sp. HY158]QGH70639.1 hypothetical protein GCE65_14920 [Pseudactinotalea sp. HY158]